MLNSPASTKNQLLFSSPYDQIEQLEIKRTNSSTQVHKHPGSASQLPFYSNSSHKFPKTKFAQFNRMLVQDVRPAMMYYLQYPEIKNSAALGMGSPGRDLTSFDISSMSPNR